MVDTLNAKCKADDLSLKLLSSKPSLKRSLTTRCLKQHNSQYYHSQENLLRSMSIYYAHNVMGKWKFNHVRTANGTKNVPNLVPYSKLTEYKAKVNIGNVRNIDPVFTRGVACENVAEGCYRDLIEYCPRLAQFYITVNNNRVDQLKTFPEIEKKSSESIMFLVAIGGDEAPVAGTTYLISFLNVGRRIASSQENFLIFGSNVKENGQVARNYLKELFCELKTVERQIYEVESNGQIFKVEFKVESIPNDMKMLAFMAGKLINSSFYFTTFANVNQNDLNDFRKTFSMEGDSDWKPFTYNKRVADAAKVLKKKEELDKKKIKP